MSIHWTNIRENVYDNFSYFIKYYIYTYIFWNIIICQKLNAGKDAELQDLSYIADGTIKC